VNNKFTTVEDEARLYRDLLLRELGELMLWRVHPRTVNAVSPSKHCWFESNLTPKE